MYSFITILMIIVCIALILFVVIQNPKGGGLSATFGGFNNQILGVQRTTDFLEKGTWWLAVALLVFSLSSNFFVSKEKRASSKSEVATQLSKGAKN